MAGTLVIIGGHEDREGKKVVLKEVVRRAGTKRVVVVTAASEEPDEVFAPYKKAFTDLGVKEVVKVDARNPEDALPENAAEPLLHAGAVFFTGGDQPRLSGQLGDTPSSRRSRSSTTPAASSPARARARPCCRTRCW